MSTVAPSSPQPSIGDRFNPFAGEQLENPYPFYTVARREKPVFFSPALNMWVVTQYQAARDVIVNPALFSSKDLIKGIVELCPEAVAALATGVPRTPTAIDSDPPAYARWRRVLGAALSAPRMRRLEAGIREIPTPGSTPSSRSGEPRCCVTSPIRSPSR